MLHFGNSLISFQICGECFGVRVKLFLFHLHQFFFDAVHFFFLLVDHCLHLVHDICTVVYLLKLAIYFFFLNVIFRTVRFSQSPPCFIFDLVLSICFGLTASKALFITLVDRKMLGDLGLRWAILEISSKVYLPWVGAFLLIFQMIQMIWNQLGVLVDCVNLGGIELSLELIYNCRHELGDWHRYKLSRRLGDVVVKHPLPIHQLGDFLDYGLSILLRCLHQRVSCL